MRMRSVVATLFVLALVPSATLLMGSQCNVRSTVERIRDVHVAVREAFIVLDRELAPQLEVAGDRCIANVPVGMTGDQAMQSWRTCMEPWNDLVVGIETSREIFAALEQVYDDIEAGDAHESDWRFWAVQVLSHGRTILRILTTLGVRLDSISGFQDAIEQLCTLVGCEGE